MQYYAPKLQPVLKTVLNLAPQERLQLIMLLLQSLLDSPSIDAIMQAPGKRTVNEAMADFWPEDEQSDDFLEFIQKQRQLVTT